MPNISNGVGEINCIIYFGGLWRNLGPSDLDLTHKEVSDDFGPMDTFGRSAEGNSCVRYY